MKPAPTSTRPRTPLAPAFSFPCTTAAFRTLPGPIAPPLKTTTLAHPPDLSRRPRNSFSSQSSIGSPTTPIDFDFEHTEDSTRSSTFSSPASSSSHTPGPSPPPALSLPPIASSSPSRRCPSNDSRMDCDPPERNSGELLHQHEELHRAAFVDLRHATQREEEGFVARLRHWEETRMQNPEDALGMSMALSDEEDDIFSRPGPHPPPCSPDTTGHFVLPSFLNDVRIGGVGLEEEGEEQLDADDEDDLAVIVSVEGIAPVPATTNTELELDQLTLKLNGEVLSDYGQVRRYQVQEGFLCEESLGA